MALIAFLLLLVGALFIVIGTILIWRTTRRVGTTAAAFVTLFAIAIGALGFMLALIGAQEWMRWA